MYQAVLGRIKERLLDVKAPLTDHVIGSGTKARTRNRPKTVTTRTNEPK